MTSSTTSRPAQPPPEDPPPVRVREPAGLVCAVPVLIGFHPRESLVLVSTGGESGRRLGLTLRVDLPPPEDVPAVCAAAAGSLLAGAPQGAAVIVLSAGPGGTDHLPPRADVARAAVTALLARDVAVHTVVWAASTAAGAPWACYDDCGCGGRLPDPAGTEFAAAAAAAGQVVYADRAELERLVAPVDAAVLRRRDRLISARADAAVAGRDPGGDDGTAAASAVVDAALDETADGRLVLDDARVVALAAALSVPAVRDAALVRSAGPPGGRAEQLWAALTRETPAPECAEPAALLAATALLRGDGGLANVALGRAEQAWPAHRLTGLLRAAADAGISPARLRACLEQPPTDAAGRV